MVMAALVISGSVNFVQACDVCTCPDCSHASMNCMPQDGGVAVLGAVFVPTPVAGAPVSSVDVCMNFPDVESSATDVTSQNPPNIPLFLQLQTLLI